MARPTNAAKVREALIVALPNLYATVAEGDDATRVSVFDVIADASGVDRGKVIDALNAVLFEPDTEPVDTYENGVTVAGVATELAPLREGYGYIVIDAPVELVVAFANLHPADKGPISMQAAGALRTILWEMGRMRSPIDALLDADPVDIAVVAAAPLTDEGVAR